MIQGPIRPKATVRFRHLFEWNGTDTILLSRATDETGYTQPTVQQLWEARGPSTSYHQNHQRAWKIARTGEVTFGLGELV
jgi:sulfane dehydrogenase subunit SoxC